MASRIFLAETLDQVEVNHQDQLVLKGIDFSGEQFSEAAELVYSIQKGGAGLGNPITADASAKMIAQWHIANPNTPEVAVDFGKETLLWILSQAKCEGIRFYFCKNHKNTLSLVLVGYDDASREINGENIGLAGKEQPVLAEVGGGGNKQVILADIAASPDTTRYSVYKHFKAKHPGVQ
jgi:hypothetical protein